MRRFRTILLSAAIGVGCMAALAANADAQGVIPGVPAGGGQHEAQVRFGFDAFKDPEKIWRFFLMIAGAAGLGVVLAYHPSRRRASVEDLEQPKIMILYTVIGCLVGLVVAPDPAIGLAIFGIGGLMRFRTELAAAKETGRVILATILGIAIGLELWMAAIFAAVFAWLILYILEYWVNLRLVVRGVRSDTLAQTAEAYAKVLRELKCRFEAPRKNPSKGQVSFVVQHRRGLSHEEIEAKCNETIPKELRGTIDWPEE